MTPDWPQTPLRDLISHRSEFVTIQDACQYKRCRVQLHGKGVVLRDIVPGADIKTKRQQVCHTNDFLVAEIDAKVGGFGMVPDQLDGAIVSSHYFLYTVNPNKLDSMFLGWYVKTPAFREQVTARGSTNYAAIRPKQVLGFTIPLPPVAEQRRIVAKIESLAAKVEEARRLNTESQQLQEAFGLSVLRKLMDELALKYPLENLGNLLVDGTYGTSIKCFSEQVADAIPVLRIPNVASEAISFSDLKYGVLSDNEKRSLSLKEGDILVVRTNGSAELVGRCAVFPALTDLFSFASYLIRLRVNTDRLDPHFAQMVLRWLRYDGQLFDLARTTAGQYNVSLGRLRSAMVPLPDFPVQRRVVEYVNSVTQAAIPAAVHRHCVEASLIALLPAILDKAFKGEL